MTKIKFCGLSRPIDILNVNEIEPDYIGFVFAEGSRRYVAPQLAEQLKKALSAGIKAVGVFVDAPLESVAELLRNGTIDIAQLHGNEDETYIGMLKRMTGKPVIKAFKIRSAEDVAMAEASDADYVLLDSGAGTGTVFDWKLLEDVKRPYFLAGGLSPDNVGEAIARLHPYGVDVSSGIETNRIKDKAKMIAFAEIVRNEDKKACL